MSVVINFLFNRLLIVSEKDAEAAKKTAEEAAAAKKAANNLSNKIQKLDKYSNFVQNPQILKYT